MGKYFGTDGFRGEANVDLTAVHALRIGLFLGWYYGKEHRARIVIGKDTRRSSYMFEDALCAGITAAGADAYLLHVTTTPWAGITERSTGRASSSARIPAAPAICLKTPCARASPPRARTPTCSM